MAANRCSRSRATEPSDNERGENVKIAIIGAGSAVFTRELCNDFLLTPGMEDFRLALMDIHEGRLGTVVKTVRELADELGANATIEGTLDRREAVRGADYVITTFQQGGLEAYALDIEIPARYGVEQCVGDTLGPGGVFRSLRTIPVLFELIQELEELAPEALLLNYVNPMAANCLAIARTGWERFVGLCHSVQGDSAMLALWLGIPYEELVYRCAGINHQAFFLELRHHGEDLYPRLRELAKKPEIRGREPVRVELMEHFGYFVTESSGHTSEYLPYFRKTARAVEEELVPRFTVPGNEWHENGRTGGYLHHCQRVAEGLEAAVASENAEEPRRTRGREYASRIIEAIERNQPYRVNGNVPNSGLITNLPAGCIVEVACLVDGCGIQPTFVGSLPPQLAALNRTSINVQELIVEAALTGDRDLVYQAVAVDPLTGTVCTLPEVRRMIDEMLDAEAVWLPQFERSGLSLRSATRGDSPEPD
jgi:alpha-galactosidase